MLVRLRGGVNWLSDGAAVRHVVSCARVSSATLARRQSNSCSASTLFRGNRSFTAIMPSNVWRAKPRPPTSALTASHHSRTVRAVVLPEPRPGFTPRSANFAATILQAVARSLPMTCSQCTVPTVMPCRHCRPSLAGARPPRSRGTRFSIGSTKPSSRDFKASLRSASGTCDRFFCTVRKSIKNSVTASTARVAPARPPLPPL
jgi:hypothetical protein